MYRKYIFCYARFQVYLNSLVTCCDGFFFYVFVRCGVAVHCIDRRGMYEWVQRSEYVTYVPVHSDVIADMCYYQLEPSSTSVSLYCMWLVL